MFKNYLKTAWKVLSRRKVFTFISLFGIAVTLVVLMVAAAFWDQMVGPVAPETRVSRMLTISFSEMSSDHWTRNGTLGYQLLDTIARDLPAEAFTFHTEDEPAVSYRNGERIEAQLKRADGAYWRVFDFKFVEGAPFTDADEKSRSFVAVVNESTRRKLFGDASAIGRPFDLDGQTFRVVGVVEDVPRLRYGPFSDVWVPISTAKTDSYKTGLISDFAASILMKSPGDRKLVTDAIRAKLPLVELPKDFKKLDVAVDTPFGLWARGILGGSGVESRVPVLAGVLTLLVTLFLLLPTLNLVNINVSRILERASEIGVRKAFGATPGSLVGQFLVENVVLCLLGGIFGFALSRVALSVIASGGVIPHAHFTLNLRVFLYGLLVTLAFGVVSGVYPAWKMSRLAPVEALNGRSR